MIKLKNILLEKVKKGRNFTIHPRTTNAVNGLQMELDAAFPNDKIKFSSGYRDEYDQARVVYKNWKKHGGANGGREYLVGLYTDDEIANAVSDAYEAGSTKQKSIDLAKQVLDDFKSRGKYMSRHQQGNAVDISARYSIQRKVKDWINAGNSKFAESVLDEQDHLHVRLVVNASAPTDSDIDVVPIDSTTTIDTPTSDLELRRQTKYTQEKVKELQRALITLGYDLGPYGPLGDGEDGKFGPYTEDAVKMFQQDYFNDKEKWTGIVNLETNKKLQKILKNPSKVKARQRLNKKSDSEIQSAVTDLDITYNDTPEPSELTFPLKGENRGTYSYYHGSEKIDPAEVVRFLVKKGLTEAQASGIAGNIESESAHTWQTGVIGDNGTSIGLCQWHKSRVKRLYKFAKKLGLKITDKKAQLEYLWWELTNKSRYGLPQIRNVDTPEEAAAIFMLKFEHPKDKSPKKQAKRGKNARKIYNDYMKQPKVVFH